MAERWEQQENETAKAYTAFMHFRSTPVQERTIAHCCETFLGKKFKPGSVRSWADWSAKNDWIKRATEYDEHQARILAGRKLDEIEKMQSDHALEGRLMQSIATKSLKRTLKRLEEDETIELSPGLAQQLMQAGVAMQRLAVGEPDTIRKDLGDAVKQSVEIIWEQMPIQGGDDEDHDAPTSLRAVDGAA